MPATPAIWLDELIIDTAKSGYIDAPVITQLDDGNLLVAWNGNAQIFDPFGNLVGSEFSVGNLTVDALPGGGFLSLSVEWTMTGILFRLFDTAPNGDRIDLVAEDLPWVEDSWGYDTAVVVGSATSALVMWGGGSPSARIYDSTANAFTGAAFSIFGSKTVDWSTATVLKNGNYIVVASENDNNDNKLFMKVLDSTGNGVGAVTLIGSTTGHGDDLNPSVTGLAGGGFVVAWQNIDTDTDILVQSFKADGTLSGGLIAIGERDNDYLVDPAVVALRDGGFVVLYTDGRHDMIKAIRYSSTGALIGSQLTIASGTEVGTPTATLLADGRLAVGYKLSGGEIAMSILDVRDAFDGTEAATTAKYITGTIGDDIIIRKGGAQVINGWDGNDTITEAGSGFKYYGGNGNDTLVVTSGIDTDVHDGGAGIDTINWSGATIADAVFRLGPGTATNLSTGLVEVMTGFENLIGTNYNDRIIGTLGANELRGSAGDDTIDGGGGQDKLYGDEGRDTFIISRAQSASGILYDGGNGDDTLRFEGDAFEFDLRDDTILSMERLVFTDPGMGQKGLVQLNAAQFSSTGIAIAATIEGTSLPDVTDQLEITMGSTITLNLSTLSMSKFSEPLDQVRIIGDADAETITGSRVDDLIEGNGGADILDGFLGDDTYLVTDTAARVLEASGRGTDTVVAYFDYTLEAGQEIEILRLAAGTGNQSLNLTGNALANELIGNNGANALDGGAGNDIMRGMGGNDVYRVTEAGDTVFEAAGGGSDTVVATLSYALAAGQEIEVLRLAVATGSAALNLTGNAFANTLLGNSGNNILDGGAGSDALYGGGGDDLYWVASAGDKVFESLGAGKDTVVATANFALTSGQEIEVVRLSVGTGTTALNLTGNAFDQTLIGNTGSNVLNGGRGSDILVGGAGNDTFLFNTTLGTAISADKNVDRIDFSSETANEDVIALENTIFSALSAGALSASMFRANATGTAADANDYIVYNTTTGALYYDANGSAAGGATQFALLTGKPALVAADFIVV
ncbi:beta strand repeat-containing protein [Pararhizobium gei]|uniref:beta strand repeat-containing protein n=1 Tax=Pararhizobium gei TaxID=1395951 RepID=UPI0023DC372E|nr:calcium-binding protein [Rhizobium gei]